MSRHRHAPVTLQAAGIRIHQLVRVDLPPWLLHPFVLDQSGRFVLDLIVPRMGVPQVPFVIPRLLEWSDMVAVLSRIRMENGYLAYPVAYFAERRPPPQDLTAGWARGQHLYLTQLGEVEWQILSERVDYDLKP